MVTLKKETIRLIWNFVRKGFQPFFNRLLCFGHEELLVGDLTKENLKELWENRDKWRMFRGGFSLENIDTCSTCTLNKKCSLMTCRLRNYDQGNSFYNKPIECAVDYSIAL